MQFVSQEQYHKAQEQIKLFEERQARYETFRKELGARLQEFEKFAFKRKGNRIIFAGYKDGKVLIGESECDTKQDKFDFMLGKLICVRRSLGLNDISDIIKIIEPKENNCRQIIISTANPNDSLFDNFYKSIWNNYKM